MDLEKGAGLSLDKSRVPAELHNLIPLIEFWGFQSLDDQDLLVTKMQKQRPHAVDDFNRRIDEADAAITEWGRSLTELHQHKSNMDDDAWSHPYWSFMAALKLREITGGFQDSPEVEAARLRTKTQIRKYSFGEAAVKASELFREKDYQAFVETLEPFVDLLSEAQQKKLTYAKKQLGR